MAGRQDQTAKGLALADQVRCRRCRQDPALADQNAAEAIGRRHSDGCLDDLAIVEPAVAADDQRLAFKAVEAVEYRLDEGFGVAGLLEHRNLLAEPGRAGFLVREGGDGYCPVHVSLFALRSSA